LIGVGIDTVELERFRGVLARRPGLLQRLFSEGERAQLLGRADPVPGLAARFAAKEAAMKALGVGLGSVGLDELEVLTAPGGAPRLSASGRAATLAGTLGVTAWHVSLTHTAALASAVVLAEGPPAGAGAAPGRRGASARAGARPAVAPPVEP
jgi:holo-[acyl-carrier protein] synthase